MNPADIRTEYRQGCLRCVNLRPDPVEQFNLWLEEAIHAGVIEPRR